MQLHIKNMVCNRCITAVKDVFKETGVETESVALGIVHVKDDQWALEKLPLLDNRLRALGFELIDDNNARLIEQVKTTVIEIVHHGDLSAMRTNWSDYITEKTGQEYKSLSQLFSSVEGVTVEQFIILQKIEKVKELLVYNELTLSEIAWRLGYSSVAHLSTQFKKNTGMAPSAFRDIGRDKRRPLDDVGSKEVKK